MLIGLMSRLLSAHKGTVLAIVVLQLVQATANLLLPTLNAAIIDDGIIGGNTGEILHLGGLDGRNRCRPGDHGRRGRISGRRRRHGDWRPAARGTLREGAVLLLPGGRRLRCAQPRNPGHQRRRPDPKPRRPNIHHADCRAGDLHRRHRAGRAPGRGAVLDRGRGDPGPDGDHDGDRPPPDSPVPRRARRSWTGSAGCCGSRSSARMSSAASSGRTTRSAASTKPTRTSPGTICNPLCWWRR